MQPLLLLLLPPPLLLLPPPPLLLPKVGKVITQCIACMRRGGAESDGQWHGMGIECMAVRYNPMDEYYYALGGGEEIVLTRSKNLRCVH